MLQHDSAFTVFVFVFFIYDLSVEQVVPLLLLYMYLNDKKLHVSVSLKLIVFYECILLFILKEYNDFNECRNSNTCTFGCQLKQFCIE